MNKPLDILTPSQLKIVQMVLNEKASAKEIGEWLGISPLTVTKQLSNAYKRLEVKNKTELIAKYSEPNNRPSPAKLRSLSPTELKIVQVFLSESNKSLYTLAAKTGGEYSSVRKHLSRIYKKLGVRDRVELIDCYSEIIKCETTPTLDVLAPQELKIVQMVLIEQSSDQEIAERLQIEPGTVRKQLSNAYQKLGVKNKVELITRYSQLKKSEQSKEIEEELQKNKALYKEMEQLYKELHSDWLNLKTEKWLLEETVRIRDREIAELKAKLKER